MEQRASLERVVAGLVERVERRFYGKYRGFVVDAADPERLGRLKLRVPSVLGDDVVTGWASPCLPYGGAADLGLLALPPTGAGVWVEFEEGDLEFPIWVGTFWSRSGAGSGLPRPVAPDGSTGAVQDPITATILKTAAGHTVQLEDAGGAESLIVRDGRHSHRIVLDAAGVAVVDGERGHVLRLTDDGVEITDGLHGATIILGPAGIALGKDAAQPAVLGAALKSAITTFIGDLATHTHVCALPTLPSGPPVPLPTLDVPLSTRVKVT